MKYNDRIEAGLLLAEKLEKYRNEKGVVLAVPRGAVPIAFIVARELGFPLDLLMTKKIGHPANKEYAIGAVSLTDSYIVPHADVPADYIESETLIIREKLRNMYTKFMGDRPPQALTGKTVIVIDDGIATGNTLLASVNMLRRQNPAKIVIAVPVAAPGAIDKLKPHVDEIICPLVPDDFYGVGGFYRDFSQVSDTEVMHYLDKLRDIRKAG